MKILTILGTRPEIIRLSKIIPLIDKCFGENNHILVHTGQNYTESLNDIFLKEFNIRKFNYNFDIRGTFGEQMSELFPKIEKVIETERPDKFFVLGDTNSSMAAIVAKRMGITVYHLEAGNRCFDDIVPEEVNRKLIDHSSDILMTYTERSKQNLIQEGLPINRIFVTGNPMKEIMNFNVSKINYHRGKALKRFDVNLDEFYLVTLHRTENVDNKDKLNILIQSLEEISKDTKTILSLHPRTKNKLNDFNIKINNPNLICVEPMGFFEFVGLESCAKCVITDSGTVQEECSILEQPSVTIRNSTERPETIEYGHNIITGINKENIIHSVNAAVLLKDKTKENQIEGYNRTNVSKTVVKILSSYFE